MKETPRKDLCLWVVGTKDGRVRKVRVSVRAAVLGGLAAGLTCLAFVGIASDYARVQLSRAQSFFHVRKLTAEKDSLLSKKKELLSRVHDLERQTTRAATYEQQIRARLDELASILRSSDPAGLLKEPVEQESAKGAGPNGKVAKSEASKVIVSKPGMGGAEEPCKGKECSGEAATDSQDPPDIRASLAPGFVPAALDGGSSSGLLSALDDYIVMLKSLPLGYPVSGYVTSGFGYRHSPFHGGLSKHHGVDFAVARGSAISATADGEVVDVRYNRTYGLVIDIAHTDRVVTRYAHLSKALVEPGQKVCRGHLIGLAGSTGRSTGPHLHYEVRVDGKPHNPARFFQLAEELAEFLQVSAVS